MRCEVCHCSQSGTEAARRQPSRSTSADNAATALKTCAAGWEAAKARWAQAQSLAAQAVAEEAAQANRQAQMAAAGNPTAGVEQALGLAYQSPLRPQATAMGQAAINDFNQATHTAKGALVGGAAPITPHVPKAKPAHQGGILHNLEGFGKTALHDVQATGNAVTGFLGDPNNQKVFMALAGIAGGLGLMTLGIGGEVGGGLLDGTIVLSPVGVALNIVSAGAIAGGAVAAEQGAVHLRSDITHMSTGDGTSSGGSPESGSPQPTPNFIEPTIPRNPRQPSSNQDTLPV